MDGVGAPFPAVPGRGRCTELLSGGGYGRIAVTEQALPVIVPANYCLPGDGELLIATGSRTGLVHRARDVVITFETGGMDAAG
ncbi:pyridoxamine 5'-phosphate oxidase family protein [Streptomyces sp. NPDC004284]|uniref:pyridoxamine 5'-phosphate oxidase family protein n=1 Tax=Streptomyces sp. NPDC004284 TaxID=3364695 RepID=UPI003690AA32